MLFILSYFIVFSVILFYFILFYFISFHFILFCCILLYFFYFGLSYYVLSYYLVRFKILKLGILKLSYSRFCDFQISKVFFTKKAATAHLAAPSSPHLSWRCSLVPNGGNLEFRCKPPRAKHNTFWYWESKPNPHGIKNGNKYQ